MRYFFCCIVYVILVVHQVHSHDGLPTHRPFAPDGVPFIVADQPWDVEWLGNHRVLVEIASSKSPMVEVDIPWRRPDLRVDEKRVVITDAQSRRVKDILPVEVNNERGRFIFRPNGEAVQYYIYFLPYTFREGYDDGRSQPYWNDYLASEYETDSTWLRDVQAFEGEIPVAKNVRFESRTLFDFFTPMGVIATEAEVEQLRMEVKGNVSIFTEDRLFPIKLMHRLPWRWIANGPSVAYCGKAMRNEYFTWQIGVWAPKKDLRSIKLEFGDFRNGNEVIPKQAFTCFNQEGVDWKGDSVFYEVNLLKDDIQALWSGVQIPETAKPGTYTGLVHVKCQGEPTQVVEVAIEIGSEVLADKGDGDLWRHSRLRWLNSKIGIDNAAIEPYETMVLEGRRIEASEKGVNIGSNGLIDQVSVGQSILFEKPMVLEIISGDHAIELALSDIDIRQVGSGLIEWTGAGKQEGLEFLVKAKMEFDGHISTKVSVKNAGRIPIDDVRLSIDYKAGSSDYLMGCGMEGGKSPLRHVWDWEGLWDSFWIGSVKSGLHVEFRGGNYHGPLLRDYLKQLPKYWFNNGAGRVEFIRQEDESYRALASTGAISDDEFELEFAMLITPVKKLGTKKQFSQRYFHGSPASFEGAALEGANIANIHHSHGLNPYINYPFIVRDTLIRFIKNRHADRHKVKLYYTIRELSNYAYELHALRSLGEEIFPKGTGYGFPWLQEHLVDDYQTAWYTALEGQQGDASLVINGFSRWVNYYLEGLRWMYENYEIDGLYLDDVAFDREVMKRIGKIAARYRPGALIDLHSHKGYSNGPVNAYATFFPYVDRLWFGEDFSYQEMEEDEWLVTFSGIPFGVMSEMLQDGGNPYLGALYGASVRHSFTRHSPAAIWKLWEEFGVADAELLGYWDEKVPVTTSVPEVKATVYQKEGEWLVCIGNFDDQDHDVRLSLMENLPELINDSELIFPAVDGLQVYRRIGVEEAFTVEGKKGAFILIRESS